MRQQLIDQFAAYLGASRPEDNRTATTYRWAASALFDFLESNGYELQHFGAGHFQSFALWCQQQKSERTGQPWAPRSVRTAVKGARSFLKWAQLQNLCSACDLGKPPLPPVPWEEPQHLSRETLDSFLQHAKGLKDPEGTIAQLLPLTGCRIRELCSAPLAGVGRKDGTPVIRVRRKGGTLSLNDIAFFTADECDRRIPPVGLNDEAEAALVRYLSSYRRAVQGSPWLFPDPRDPASYISPDVVRRAVTSMRTALGTPWLTTHKAGRHTLAMLLLDGGASYDEIADVLGHASTETTRTTYARASPGRVAALSGKLNRR